MGCGVSTGISTQRVKIPKSMNKVFKTLVKETAYVMEELERLWVEFVNLAEGRDNENLTYVFFYKHKFGNRLIFMILEKQGLDPEKVKRRLEGNSNGNSLSSSMAEKELVTETKEKADVETLFPICIVILSTLRKANIADQLKWYFHLFDINDDGELSPEEMVRMVKVLLENNPALADIATSEGAIGKLVDEIFQEADDNGDGVLNLAEFLSHSKFITKKILLQNTNFNQRTRRLMKKMHGDTINETSYSKYSQPVELV